MPAVFAEAGMRPISQAPGMISNALPPPSRVLPEIECRPVRDHLLRTIRKLGREVRRLPGIHLEIEELDRLAIVEPAANDLPAADAQ